MVLIIILAVIVAFIVAYFVVKKTSSRSGEPASPNHNLHQISPPNIEEEARPRRPKY